MPSSTEPAKVTVGGGGGEQLPSCQEEDEKGADCSNRALDQHSQQRDDHSNHDAHQQLHPSA